MVLTEEMTEKTLLRTRELLEAAGKARPQPGTVEQQVADYYAAYLDEAAIEAKGAGAAGAARRADRRRRLEVGPGANLGEELRADVDALNNTDLYTDRLFGLWVTAGLNDPGTNTPYLLQGGLDMPDRQYYVDPSARHGQDSRGS